jgi:gamma-glutamylputrescine oxidase
VRALQADIKKTYPQLGEVAVDYAWAGTMGNTVHRMPQIGELGSGVWLASGFGGSGLNTTAMAGNLIARAIVEGDQAWRQFSPFELVWAGGVAGRVAIQMRSWIKRFRERTAERRAHAREITHRQACEAELLTQAREREAAAQAAAAQNAAVAAAPAYIEPEPAVTDEASTQAEPLANPPSGRHRARRRKKRERSEGVS